MTTFYWNQKAPDVIEKSASRKLFTAKHNWAVRVLNFVDEQKSSLLCSILEQSRGEKDQRELFNDQM